MVQKSGEKTTWDGAKTPVNNGMFTISTDASGFLPSSVCFPGSVILQERETQKPSHETGKIQPLGFELKKMASKY